MTRQIETSKMMAYFLRHAPEKAGLVLDSEGFTDIKKLAAACRSSVQVITQIVQEDNKGRYAIKGDLIRANQGHSTKAVDIQFKIAAPPPLLFHGTTVEAFESIKSTGILPMSRALVHLSDNLETAKNVAGRRKAETVILVIDAAKMLADGLTFKISDNGVWLIEEVQPKYFWKYIE